MLSLIANSVCDRHSCKLLKKLLNLCMTRACFRCSDSGVGNKKSVFLLISLCTVQPIIARYHEIRCIPPIIVPYLHIRISNLPYPSYPYIQLAISFMSSYVSYPYIRNAISLIFSYPYITASHSLLSWYPRVEQTYLRNTLISVSLILACVASVSARVRLENRDERKQEEWSGRVKQKHGNCFFTHEALRSLYELV